MKPEANPPAAASSRTAEADAGLHARRSRLGIEITVALCVKLLLLFGLYQIWFSQPQSKRLTGHGVAAALFGPVNNPLPREEHRDGSGP
jgi:hypothetical protein